MEARADGSDDERYSDDDAQPAEAVL